MTPIELREIDLSGCSGMHVSTVCPFSHAVCELEAFMKLTSGPLKTLGSFMSFQTYRSLVDPLYLARVNCCDHQSWVAGFRKSG